MVRRSVFVSDNVENNIDNFYVSEFAMSRTKHYCNETIHKKITQGIDELRYIQPAKQKATNNTYFEFLSVLEKGL